MHTGQNAQVRSRRNFLFGGVTLAGTAALVGAGQSQANEPPKGPALAQAVPDAATSVATSPITVKSVERLVGSEINYAYAVKAGNWV
jgi:hypothetical protein